MKYALGIDIGGKNIKALALTPAGKLLAEINTPTGDVGNQNWIKNVLLAKKRISESCKAQPTWIGVAAPGLAAKDQRLILHMPGRLKGLEGLIWQKIFRAQHPVLVLNDAHAAMLGEVWRGAARGKDNAILLTLGTGVGGAAWIDGRLLRGHLGRAGHFGHISLDSSGKPDIVHTPGSLEDAIGECTLEARTRGRFTSTKELVAASSKNLAAQKIWLRSIQALATGIASLINALDPEVVVLGGGITRSGARLFRPLNEQLSRLEWRPGNSKVRIVAAQLGDNAGAFGAAWNALRSNSPH